MLDFIHTEIAVLPNNMYGSIQHVLHAYECYCRENDITPESENVVLNAVISTTGARIVNGLLEGASAFDADTLLKPRTHRSPLTLFIRDYCRVRKDARTPTLDAYHMYTHLGGDMCRNKFTREMCRALAGRIDKKLVSIKGVKHNAFVNLEMI
ncbi:hypothetical protein NVP1171O_83 [Vibrio phage 1.171.O._10N.261.52.F12]|nr:hypothetical protein NVP1171O_83 [Vibrio phage 1.171.O._10N.261.52.F12]